MAKLVDALNVTVDTFDKTKSEDKFLFENIFKDEDMKMNSFLATIYPGEYIPPHIHPSPCETFIYIVSGKVRHYFGENLTDQIDNQAGDLVRLKPDIPHQPTNLCNNEPVHAIVICNYDQNDTNNTIPYDQHANTIHWELQGLHLRDWEHERHVGPVKADS